MNIDCSVYFIEKYGRSIHYFEFLTKNLPDNINYLTAGREFTIQFKI